MALFIFTCQFFRRHTHAADPKLRVGSFFPDEVIERYQRVDRSIVAPVSEMYATGASTRKVQKVAQTMGIERLSKDRSAPSSSI